MTDARSRYFLVRELELKKRKQNLWHRIRHLAPNPDPYSEDSSRFFYEECEKNGIPLDEAEQEDYNRILKNEEKRLSKQLALGAD